MSVSSKYFYKAVEGLTCADLFHGNASTCWESTLWNLTKTISGCCKYVFPIAVVSTYLNLFSFCFSTDHIL